MRHLSILKQHKRFILQCIGIKTRVTPAYTHMSTMQESCTDLRVQVVVNEELAMARLVKEGLQASDKVKKAISPKVSHWEELSDVAHWNHCGIDDILANVIPRDDIKCACTRTKHAD